MSGTKVATARVVAVLLADGWHQVARGSFSVGLLEFGAEVSSGALGFRFEEADSSSPYCPAVLAGPLGAILAVRQVRSVPRDPGGLACPPTRHWTRSSPEAVA